MRDAAKADCAAATANNCDSAEARLASSETEAKMCMPSRVSAESAFLHAVFVHTRTAYASPVASKLITNTKSAVIIMLCAAGAREPTASRL